MKNIIWDVQWTGDYPNLCNGQWIIKKDGQDVSHFIPKDMLHAEMGTAGIYRSWRFDNDWDVIWDEYEDGFECEDWIDANWYWLENICDDEDEAVSLYYDISVQDFRYGSCGGCI